MIFVAIQLLMDKLGDLVIDNSLSLTVSYQVDQHLLAKNFTTILNALKELQASQQKTQSQLKDLSSLKEKYDQLGAKVEKLEKNTASKESSSNNNQNGGQGDHSGSNYQNLAKRVEKSENNIMENIKDINLINKDLSDVKKLIEDLKNQLSHLGSGDLNKHDKTGYGVEDVASNLSKELHLSAEKMKELEVKLLKAEEHISKHDKDIKDLLENKDKDKGGQAQSSSGEKSGKQLEDLKRDLREKLEIINKKINNLQSDTDNHEQQIAQIKEIIGQQEDNKPQQEVDPSSHNKDTTNVSKSDLNDLRRKLEQVDKRQVKDIKNLLEELNSLKKQLQQIQQPPKIDTKSSIEQENSKSNRKSAIQRDELNEKLNDLILRVNYLEKLLSGSKSNITEDKNPEKLPALTRPRKGNMTVYQEKEKSGISRKDISELKAELQAWIKSLFEQNKDRENLEDIELKLQEIKKSLQKKADAEGTKKGFTFLENKITQLYLFLTEPETEDAMIVRKGFNCLSCSKRVEKLRGRIGPKLNWNNMTSTNYSPPRVGYSKPMGEQSGEKEDDL